MYKGSCSKQLFSSLLAQKVKYFIMKNLDYSLIYKHYEETLEKHGPNFKGMDWPNENDLFKRFDALIQLIPLSEFEVSLLDLGCGIGLLIDFLTKKGYFDRFIYTGIDISEKMINYALNRYPDISFKKNDILKTPLKSESYDYVLMNGLLTEKISLNHKEMVLFAQEIITAAYKTSRKGIAFNVMSSHVDWTRPDLFHWPLDDVVSFLVKKLSRNIVINMNYGLYEYIVYLYKPQ